MTKRKLCRTCASYHSEQCALIGQRVKGAASGKPCWQRRNKKPTLRLTGQQKPEKGKA